MSADPIVDHYRGMAVALAVAMLLVLIGGIGVGMHLSGRCFS